MPEAVDQKRIAENNRAVDLKRLEEALEFCKRLEKAGVLRTVDYQVSPPLGGAPPSAKPGVRRIDRMTHFS